MVECRLQLNVDNLQLINIVASQQFLTAELATSRSTGQPLSGLHQRQRQLTGINVTLRQSVTTIVSESVLADK